MTDKSLHLFGCSKLTVFLILLFHAVVAGAHGTGEKGLISPAELAANSSVYKIIDLRSRAVYAESHVRGALLLPLQEISQKNLQALGVAAGDQVVLYADSESSPKKARMLLEILGYTNMKILAGGFTHWLEDGQPVAAGVDSPSRTAEAVGAEPTLVVRPMIHDFGTIKKEGGTVSTTFTIENPGTAEISVTEITTSCGCTSAEIEEKTIPPGGSRRLTVFFDPNFHKEPEGKFSRTVFIETANGTEVQAKIEVEIAQ